MLIYVKTLKYNYIMTINVPQKKLKCDTCRRYIINNITLLNKCYIFVIRINNCLKTKNYLNCSYISCIASLLM